MLDSLFTPPTGRVILARKIGEHRPFLARLDINYQRSFEPTRYRAELSPVS